MENGVTKVMMEPWKQASGRVTRYSEVILKALGSLDDRYK